MLPLYFDSLAQHHQDFTLHMLEALLSRRQDFDRRAIKEAVQACTTVIQKKTNIALKSTQLSAEPHSPATAKGFFSNVSLSARRQFLQLLPSATFRGAEEREEADGGG